MCSHGSLNSCFSLLSGLQLRGEVLRTLLSRPCRFASLRRKVMPWESNPQFFTKAEATKGAPSVFRKSIEIVFAHFQKWRPRAQQKSPPWENTAGTSEPINLLPSTLVSNSALHPDRFQAVSNFPLYFTWSFSRLCGRGVWSSASHGAGEAAQWAAFPEPALDKQQMSPLLAWQDGLTG